MPQSWVVALPQTGPFHMKTRLRSNSPPCARHIGRAGKVYQLTALPVRNVACNPPIAIPASKEDLGRVANRGPDGLAWSGTLLSSHVRCGRVTARRPSGSPDSASSTPTAKLHHFGCATSRFPALLQSTTAENVPANMVAAASKWKHGGGATMRRAIERQQSQQCTTNARIGSVKVRAGSRSPSERTILDSKGNVHTPVLHLASPVGSPKMPHQDPGEIIRSRAHQKTVCSSRGSSIGIGNTGQENAQPNLVPFACKPRMAQSSQDSEFSQVDDEVPMEIQQEVIRLRLAMDAAKAALQAVDQDFAAGIIDDYKVGTLKHPIWKDMSVLFEAMFALGKQVFHH